MMVEAVGDDELDLLLPNGRTAVHHFHSLLGDVTGDGFSQCVRRDAGDAVPGAEAGVGPLPGMRRRSSRGRIPGGRWSDDTIGQTGLLPPPITVSVHSPLASCPCMLVSIPRDRPIFPLPAVWPPAGRRFSKRVPGG
jgi:hypothetical protein